MTEIGLFPIASDETARVGFASRINAMSPHGPRAEGELLDSPADGLPVSLYFGGRADRQAVEQDLYCRLGKIEVSA